MLVRVRLGVSAFVCACVRADLFLCADVPMCVHVGLLACLYASARATDSLWRADVRVFDRYIFFEI